MHQSSSENMFLHFNHACLNSISIFLIRKTFDYWFKKTILSYILGTDSSKQLESIQLKDFDSILDKYLNVPGNILVIE